MAVTSGFFNAQYSGSTPDRAYNAEQFGELLVGIMNDGVYGSVGSAFEVSAGTDMSIRVGTGRAWFNNVWIKNSNLLTLNVYPSSETLGRYDAVVIDINKSVDVRSGSIYIVQGTPSSTPEKPAMIHTEEQNQYPIAYIYIAAGVSSISSSAIEITVGTSACPFAASLLNGISIIGQVETTAINSLDVFLLEREGEGLKKVTAGNLMPALMESMSPKNHRRMYRGKHLGSALSSAQSEAIADGSFKDIFVGDYWTIGGVNYRIVDIDYWYGIGDTKCVDHHVVIMPDTVLATSQMNSTATTAGAYMSTIPVHSTLNTIRTTYLEPAFGADHILNHRGLFQDASNNGMPTNTSWSGSRTELPSEIQIFGTHNMGAMTANNVLANHKTVDRVQFALFDIDPSAIVADSNYWLRDIVNTTEFACIFADGSSGRSAANAVNGLRPVFGVIGG